MNDREIIEKVQMRYAGRDGSNYRGDLIYCTKVLVRYTRWLERERMADEYGIILHPSPEFVAVIESIEKGLGGS